MSNICKMINYNFYAAKKSMFISLGIYGAMWLITILTSFQFISLLPVACASMVFEPIFINENKNNAKKVMGILPIKRYEFILSRYIMFTVTTIVFGVISFGIIKISDHITPFDMAELFRLKASLGIDADISVSFVGMTLCLGLCLGAIEFFCRFVFSADKANLAIIAIMMIPIIAFVAVLYLVSGDLETMLDTLNNLPVTIAKRPYKFAGTAVLIGLIVDIVFCGLSTVVVNKKEI